MSLFGLSDIVLRPRTAWHHDPDALAVVSAEERITYAELAERIRGVAAGLQAHGFRRGDVVAVYLTNRTEYLEAVLAVAHLGGVLVPLNYLLRATEVEFIVRDSGASWLITEPRQVEHTREVDGVRRIMVGADLVPDAIAWPDLRSHDPATAPDASVTTDEIALLQYTSGTTGFPKGAVHTHGSILFNALAQVVDFDVTRRDVHLVVPSLSWAAGLHCLTLSTLWRGGTVVLRSTGGFDPDELCATVASEGVTTGMFAPSILRLLLSDGALDRHDLTSLRLVLSGGEPVTAETITQVQRRVPGLRLHQGYGVSEFPSTMLHLAADDVAEHGGAAGLSSISANVRVVDADGMSMPPSEHGEIAVRSPQTSAAYHHGDGSRSTAVKNGWLMTGDRGFVDEDGFVHVAGRVKEMILSGGLNVYPAEVERVVAEFPEVREVAVVGVPDDHYGEVGHAHVVVETGARLDEAALRAYVRERLAGFKVPRYWTLRTESLPRTVTGKIRRFELI